MKETLGQKVGQFESPAILNFKAGIQLPFWLFSSIVHRTWKALPLALLAVLYPADKSEVHYSIYLGSICWKAAKGKSESCILNGIGAPVI